MSVNNQTITWRYDIPLLTSRFMLWEYLKVTAISAAALWVVGLVIGLVSGDGIALLPLRLVALVAAILLALFAIASLLLGNRHGAVFTVSPDGVGYEAEPRERRINRIVAALGTAGGRPSVAGAGLLAISREAEHIPWSDVRSVKAYPGPRVVVIKNSWRVLARLYCPPELFDRVAAACLEYHSAARSAAGKTPGERQ
jgi:hypothetical protein